MARGWESKSIESQMESAEARHSEEGRIRLTQHEIARQREREGVELSRKRVLSLIAESANPRYRTMLEKALADLDQKLKLLY